MGYHVVIPIDSASNLEGVVMCYPKAPKAPKARQSPTPRKTSSVPANWPTDIQYIDTPRYALNFPKEISNMLRGSSAGRPYNSTAMSVPELGLRPARTTICRVENPNHPALGQRGLFAAKTIPSHTFIIQYVGELHIDERPTSDYDLSLIRFPTSSSLCNGQSGGNDLIEGSFISVGIDAAKIGNEARFVNDYRGTGEERPNAFFKDVRGEDGTLHITIWTGAKPIAKGKEILVSYGKGWWAAR